MAAVDQIAHGLGYKTEVQKEELLVVARTGLRFVRGAAVVWLGYSVIPLPARARLDGGHWWVSTDSVPGIFSNFLKKNGRNITLQWAGAAPPKASPPAPAKSPSQKPETKKPPLPETPPPPVANLPRVAGLRWGGTQEAVRAVLDLESGLRPQYSLAGESLTVTVDRLSPAVLPKIKSARADIDLKVQNGAPAKIQFSFPGRTASVFTLSDPYRFVIDFKTAPGRREEAKTPPPPAPKPQPLAPAVKHKPAENSPAPANPPAKVPAKAPAKGRKRIVVIDAGHGGKDPGAMAHGYREKIIALQIATRVASELRKQGVDVRMTRTGDTYPTLRERTTMANNWNADVFVSIHLNALPKGKHSKGIEIYIMALPTDKDAMTLAKIENAEIAEEGSGKKGDSDGRTEMLLSILGNMQQNAKISESTLLAEELFKSGQKSGLDMKRVAQAPFWVLRGAGMPSVLIETGFITELSEVRRLARADYQQKMAQSFASGIMTFINTMSGGKGF